MKRLMMLTMVAVLATAAQASDLSSYFTNLDFDDCTQEQIGSFDAPYDVPGWNDYKPPTNALIDAGIGAEGTWWLNPGPNGYGYAAWFEAGDGATNLSTYTIQAGDVFDVAFISEQWWNSAQLTVSLYYDDPTNVIGSVVANTASWFWQSYSGGIPATAASVGGTLGVLVQSTGGSIATLENLVVSMPAYVSATDPANGDGDVDIDLADRDIPDNISWTAPSDANILSIQTYDIYVDPNQAKVYSHDAGCEIVDTVAGGTTQYNPASNLSFGTDYYMQIVTNYTHDALGAGQVAEPNAIVFTTETPAPVIADFNNVTALIGTNVTLVAHVTDADGDLDTGSGGSASFTLLTDDIDFPTGATFTKIGESVSDPYNPSVTVSADAEGYFKVMLTVTDGGGNTDTQIGEVAYFPNDDPNACDARKWMIWIAGQGQIQAADFDQDCDVDLYDAAELFIVWLDDQKLTAPEQYINNFVPYTPFETLDNGDFELGDLSGVGWSQDAAVTNVSPISGTYSAEITSDGTSGIGWYVALHNNTHYIFELTLQGGAAGDEFGVRYTGDAGVGHIGDTVIPAGGYATATTIQVDFTTSPVAIDGQVYDCWYYSKTAGTLKIDDVSIYQVP